MQCCIGAPFVIKDCSAERHFAVNELVNNQGVTLLPHFLKLSLKPYRIRHCHGRKTLEHERTQPDAQFCCSHGGQQSTTTRCTKQGNPAPNQ